MATEEAVDVALTFLETAIHSVLFYRGVYPPAAFERRRAYGLGVYMSRHPGLNDTIAEALYAARAPMLRGEVEALTLAVMDGGGAPLERFRFRVDAHAPSTPATYSDVDS